MTMKQETFSIPNISCGHCTASIENELKELEGVTAVKGDIESRSVDIQWAAPATREQILAILKEINYPAAV
jgi:copper chaperone CopZ